MRFTIKEWFEIIFGSIAGGDVIYFAMLADILFLG